MSGSADSNNGLIQMEVSKIRIDERRGEQVVVLKEKGGNRLLPIIIGISEVTAIKMKISGIQPPRPLTHDLLKNTISQLDAAEPLTVYANVARPFKSPNVFDFAVAIDFGFIGNAELKPQQGTEYEVGVRLHDPHLGSLGANWFHSKVEDEILFNNLTFRSENFDTARTGVELTVKPTMPIPKLNGLFTYTFLKAEFRKGLYKDKSLPGVPEHQAALHLSYKPIPKLQCSLDWMIVHDFFRINDFTNSLPGDNYGVLNLGIRYHVKPNATLHFRVENATNEEYTSFQSSNGVTVSTGENPAPPVVFAGGITLQF